MSGVRHTPPPCQSRRACELLDHEHLGHDGGDQRQPLGRHVGRPAAAEALATADGRLEGHHAAPVRVHGGGRTSSPVTSDCMGAHSMMPCVRPTSLRPAPAAPEARDVPSQLAIAHSERFVHVLCGCYLYLAKKVRLAAYLLLSRVQRALLSVRAARRHGVRTGLVCAHTW